MKFREFKKTPNGFIIGKWYNGTCGMGTKCKWKIVDQNRISNHHNIWKNAILKRDSEHIYALCSNTRMWPENTVIRVGFPSIDRNS
jgi:hypothetical protein